VEDALGINISALPRDDQRILYINEMEKVSIKNDKRRSFGSQSFALSEYMN
jgi:hypothetical protein